MPPKPPGMPPQRITAHLSQFEYVLLIPSLRWIYLNFPCSIPISNTRGSYHHKLLGTGAVCKVLLAIFVLFQFLPIVIVNPLGRTI